ncbi:hypothetical protein ACE1AT_11175 [Pelatocladus sp. BLCC-F211]|uniref:hypothetical protein n=1 Tax=Pelatocladus sp. BLCC-F211 TaxID=3342752 RepID=UPI0035B91765
MTIKTGYAIADITTLKALTSSQRIDGYARLVKSGADGKPAWYTFIAASAETGDNDTAITPDDSPSTGRWIKSSGAGGSTSIPGRMICISECSLNDPDIGKAFEFYAPYTGQINIQVGFDIAITPDEIAIELHRWNVEPNTDLNGREWVADLPHTGGTATVSIDSDYRWISVFAKNGGSFDATCFTMDGSIATLLSFE